MKFHFMEHKQYHKTDLKSFHSQTRKAEVKPQGHMVFVGSYMYSVMYQSIPSVPIFLKFIIIIFIPSVPMPPPPPPTFSSPPADPPIRIFENKPANAPRPGQHVICWGQRCISVRQLFCTVTLKRIHSV